MFKKVLTCAAVFLLTENGFATSYSSLVETTQGSQSQQKWPTTVEWQQLVDDYNKSGKNTWPYPRMRTDQKYIMVINHETGKTTGTVLKKIM